MELFHQGAFEAVHLVFQVYSYFNLIFLCFLVQSIQFPYLIPFQLSFSDHGPYPLFFFPVLTKMSVRCCTCVCRDWWIAYACIGSLLVINSEGLPAHFELNTFGLGVSEAILLVSYVLYLNKGR